MTIEDETGYANLVIFENLFNLYRKEIIQSKLITVEGELQIKGKGYMSLFNNVMMFQDCYDN